MRFTHKQIWVITFPILVSLLMEHLINMTDTAFLGRVGEVELGASALAGVYYMAIYMLAFGFSIGAQILIGRRNGEGNYKDIGPIFIQGVLFLVGLATLMFTVSRIYTPSVLRSVIDSEQVYVATNDYMKWRYSVSSSRLSLSCSGPSSWESPRHAYSRSIRLSWSAPMSC